ELFGLHVRKPEIRSQMQCVRDGMSSDVTAHRNGVSSFVQAKPGSGNDNSDDFSGLDFFPTLHDVKSEPILTPPMIENLFPRLPASLRTNDLRLLYSMMDHGASIQTLIRQSKGKGPTLLIVADDKKHVI